MSKDSTEINAISTYALTTQQKVKATATYLFVKRLLDIIFASIGLILTLPIFIFVSIMYLFEDIHGPLFFITTLIFIACNT